MKLSYEQRRALALHLTHRFNLFVRDKDGSIPMEVIARLFNVAELLGANVPTGDEFITRYWTTLGPVVFAPMGSSSNLGEHLRVFGHEATHGVQFWRNVLTLLAKYATQRGRAELEAEAERGAIEVEWLTEGTTPTSLADMDRCRHGYAIESKGGDHDDFADLARDLIEQSIVSVRQGVLSTDVGIATHQWMLANAPDCIVGKVV